MRNFRKTIITILCFFVACTIISFCMIAPYFITKPYYYQDSQERAELSGTINYIISGASHALGDLNPQIIDEILDVDSYNLSGSLMTMQGRYALLQKELSRNPVDTVVLELSYNSMSRTEGFEGDYYVLGRWESIPEMCSFFFSAISPKDYGKAYYHALHDGVESVAYFIMGETFCGDRGSLKGFLPGTTGDLDVSLSIEKQKEEYNTKTIDTEITEYNDYYLNKIIDICKEKDIEVILIATPLSNSMICRTKNLDEIRDNYQRLADKEKLSFIDFSLLKDRDDFLDDHVSYRIDECHLTDEAAEAFSRRYAEVMKELSQGKDITEEFYISYAEMESHKPYLE